MKTRDKTRFLQIRVTEAEKAAIKAEAARAGTDMSSYVLARVLPAARAEFERLVADLADAPELHRLILPDIEEFLTRIGPRAFAAMTDGPPAVRLEPYLANYLAAMVESAAHRLDLPAPAWTDMVKPLAKPAFASSEPAQRLHLLLDSPPPFRRRNIFIDPARDNRP